MHSYKRKQLWPNWPPFLHSYNRTGYSSSIMLRKKRLCIYHRFLFSSQVPAPTFVYFPVVNESKRADSAVPTLPQGKIKGTVLCKATFLVNIHGTTKFLLAGPYELPIRSWLIVISEIVVLSAYAYTYILRISV